MHTVSTRTLPPGFSNFVIPTPITNTRRPGMVAGFCHKETCSGAHSGAVGTGTGAGHTKADQASHANSSAKSRQARYVNGSGSAGGLSKMRRSVTHRAAQLGDDSMIAQLCFAPDGMLFPRSLDPTTQQFRTRAVARVFRHQALPSHHRGHLQCTGDAIDPFTRGSGSGGHQPV